MIPSCQPYVTHPISPVDRVDPQDRGGEYRSLLGLPGGSAHESYPEVQKAAGKYGFNLALGQGNDPDTLGKALVYVYDTKRFPFYQAEVYHQVSVDRTAVVEFTFVAHHFCSFYMTAAFVVTSTTTTSKVHPTAKPTISLRTWLWKKAG
jgi:hypothetical protein